MSIKATCTCGAEFKAKSELAGKRVKCPTCGQAFTVPKPQAAADLIRVTCQCGKSMRAKRELAGKQVKCPACGQALAIPDPNLQTEPLADPTWDAWDQLSTPASTSGEEPEASTCPNCGTAMSSEAKVCPECWYHMELGRTINPMGAKAELLCDTKSFEKFFELEAGVLTIRLGLFGRLFPIRVDSTGISKRWLRIPRQDLVDVFMETRQRTSINRLDVDSDGDVDAMDIVSWARGKTGATYCVKVRKKRGLFKERTLTVVHNPNLANYIVQRIKQHIAAMGR